MKKWIDLEKLETKNYICGYCGSDIASNEGYMMYDSASGIQGPEYIYICHKCKKPTYFDYFEQYLKMKTFLVYTKKLENVCQ